MLKALKHKGPTDRPGLIKAIHAAARELGLEEDVRRDLQQHATGKASCATMTLPELRTVYGRLSVLQQGLPRRRAVRRRRPGLDERQPEELLTTEQQHLIRHLFEHVEMRAQGCSPTWRMRLCQRLVKKSWPQTRAEGNKIIECLKGMDERGWTPRSMDSQGEGLK